MHRNEALETASALINGDRQDDYGSPQENFTRIAQLWAPVFGQDVTPAQVALALTLLKVARLIHTPAHADSWVDAAGYVALGAELATEPQDRHVTLREHLINTFGNKIPVYDPQREEQ